MSCRFPTFCLSDNYRSSRFLLMSFCVIVLNASHTVTRSLEPSVTCLLGLPCTGCLQAVAAIWFTNKKVPQRFVLVFALQGSVRGHSSTLAAFLKEIPAKMRGRLLNSFCQFILIFVYYIEEMEYIHKIKK